MLTFAIIALIATNVLADIDLLKNMRPKIDVIPYTPAQRKQVAESVKNLLKIYVNRQSKLDNYQKEFEQLKTTNEAYDPIVRAENILKEAEKMQDLEFHYKFVELFNSLRDFHTQYEIPGSHSCINAYIPITFRVLGNSTNQKIVVSAKERNQAKGKLSPQVFNTDIGHELIAINGIAIQKYLDDLKFVSGGANESGSLRASISALSNIHGKTSKLPELDYNEYLLRSFSGRNYTIQVPWLVTFSRECWEQSKLLSAAVTINGLNTRKRPRLDIAEHPILHKRSSAKDIFWTIHAKSSKNLGVITLKTQHFNDPNFHSILTTIRGLLLNELKDTNAVLFDVRWNLGTLTALSDLIPQLFGRNITTTSARLLIHDINRDLLLNPQSGHSGRWKAAYLKANEGDVFAPPLKFTKDEHANSLGQAYVRPVGVFTSGRCYSACEVFVANMKDNKIATVFGEDERTGGGGSDYAEYNSFFSSERPDHFPPVPYKTELSNLAQDFSIGWRQTVRIDGSLIEDIGIESDYILRPKITDIDPKRNQYDQIAKILIGKGKANGQNKLHFQIEPSFEVDVFIGDPIFFQLDTRGYSFISVLDANGLSVAKFKVNPTIRNRKVVKTQYRNVGFRERFNIQGLDEFGKVLFSTWRTIRFVPRKSDYLQVSGKTKIDLTNPAKYLGFHMNVGNGRFGNGIGIPGSLEAENEISIKLFLASPNGCKITIQAVYDIETDDELLRIGYIIGMKSNLLLTVTGKGVVNQTFPLPAGDIEFFIESVSDREVNSDKFGTSSRIDSITVE